MVAIVIGLLCGVASAAIVSDKRGRSTTAYFFLGFFLGPFGILFAFIAKPDAEKSDIPKDTSKYNMKLSPNGKIIWEEKVK